MKANNLPTDIKKKLIPIYEDIPHMKEIATLLKMPREKDFHATELYKYCLDMDKSYEGTKWEMNQNVLIKSNETYHTSLKKEVVKFRNKISEQMKDLQIDLVTSENHIKKQNENIEGIQKEIKEAFDKLQLDVLEERNKELVENIRIPSIE